jgi:hypothetical protein
LRSVGCRLSAFPQSRYAGRSEVQSNSDANKVAHVSSKLKACELGKRLGEGQTMTEYALILAAVAIVIFITYEVMGLEQPQVGPTPGHQPHDGGAGVAARWA